MAGIWRCRSRRLPLDRTLVMGVLNVTPDSFYDGGTHHDLEQAVAHGLAMVEAGADVVDVGGESTRPGAATVPESEEIRRTVPVVERLVAEGVCVSIDTRKPGVAHEAVAAGASVVNDVAAGLYVGEGPVGGAENVGTLRVAARDGCGLVLMHMRGEPATMQDEPLYDDVVADVRDFLEERVRAARLEGCEPETIAVDPGIGFGKTLGHNLSLLGRLDELGELGLPVLVGTSRKSMFDHLLDLPVSERLVPSLATAVTAVLLGASIVRAHDVPETVSAVRWADDLRLSSSLSPDA